MPSNRIAVPCNISLRAELLVDAFYNHSLLSPLELHISFLDHSLGCRVQILIEPLLCIGLWVASFCIPSQLSQRPYLFWLARISRLDL